MDRSLSYYIPSFLSLYRNISPDEVKIRCGEYDLRNESEQYEYQERKVKKKLYIQAIC